MSAEIILNPAAPNLKNLGKELHKTSRYSESPTDAIREFVEPFLDKIRVSPAKILVATYRQKEKTKGGLILSNGYLEEDRFQGIVGLVLKAGPLAFEDSPGVKFGGFKAEPFEWVVYKPENGRATELNGLHCRIIEDIHIDAVAEDPELLW